MDIALSLGLDLDLGLILSTIVRKVTSVAFFVSIKNDSLTTLLLPPIPPQITIKPLFKHLPKSLCSSYCYLHA